jgi:hypothetical protein
VHPVVVLLDLHEVDRVAEPGGLEQVPRVGPQHGHLGELVPVALEVAVVYRVEPGEGCPQPHVGLGDRVADEIAAGRQPLGEPVQPREQAAVGRVVRGLGGREPALVDAVVHVPVDEGADLLDLIAQPLRIQVRRARPVAGGPLLLHVQRDMPEVGGHHRAARDVHDRRDGHAAVVAGDRLLVRLTEPVDAEHRVDSARVEVERPAPPVVLRSADAHGEDGLEPEQAADDQRPGRPRAGAGHHQPVPPRLHGPAISPVRRDAPVEVCGVTNELASFAHATETRLSDRPCHPRRRTRDR